MLGKFRRHDSEETGNKKPERNVYRKPHVQLNRRADVTTNCSMFENPIYRAVARKKNQYLLENTGSFWYWQLGTSVSFSHHM